MYLRFYYRNNYNIEYIINFMTFVPCVFFFILKISITNELIHILTRNKLFSQIISNIK